MNHTCDTCQHWAHEKRYEHWLARPCSCPKIMDGDGQPDGAIPGEPADGTYFSTGPKFGCIHHEPVHSENRKPSRR